MRNSVRVFVWAVAILICSQNIAFPQIVSKPWQVVNPGANHGALLGIKVTTTNSGLRITQVEPTGPARGILFANDTLLRAAFSDGLIQVRRFVLRNPNDLTNLRALAGSNKPIALEIRSGSGQIRYAFVTFPPASAPYSWNNGYTVRPPAATVRPDSTGGAQRMFASTAPTNTYSAPITANPKTNLPSFPWPPPRASGREQIPRDFLDPAGAAKTLRDVDRRLMAALDENGYYESSYFSVPRGFALATRIERISDDGSPKPGAARWSLKQQRLNSFSLVEYIKALFGADPGKYRVIVFVVKRGGFNQSSNPATAQQAQQWLASGRDVLPKSIADQPYKKDYNCTALIYEFERPSEVAQPRQNTPGLLLGRVHLQRSGLWESLRK